MNRQANVGLLARLYEALLDGHIVFWPCFMPDLTMDADVSSIPVSMAVMRSVNAF